MCVSVHLREAKVNSHDICSRISASGSFCTTSWHLCKISLRISVWPYQDPAGPLVQDLCIRVLRTACVRILYGHLCKISVSGSFWTAVSGSGWTTVSGSCWTTCARSVFQDLCVRILWTTCIRILQEHLYKIPVMRTLAQDLFIRIL